MNRAQEITKLCEAQRGAYQIFVTPSDDSVNLRFADLPVGNDDLSFPPMTLSHSEFFEIVPHNELTDATFQNALDRGDTYGLLVSPVIVSRLSRKAVPATDGPFQHTVDRQFPTEADWHRASMRHRRV
jgi:hypothetical protein